jgi:hypothetical protein
VLNAVLNRVKTTRQAEPEVVKAVDHPARGWVPVWSPSGASILHDHGESLTYSTVKSTANLWRMEGLDTVALPQPHAP